MPSKKAKNATKKAKRAEAKVEQGLSDLKAAIANSRSGKASSRVQLANASYYLKSIIDPFNFPGSKIPDQVTLPSATSQCVYRFQSTVNAQGVAGVWVQMGNTSLSSGLQTCATTATAGALTWNAAATKSYSVNFQGVAQSRRIVSGFVSYEYQGAPLNRKGRAILDFEGYQSNFISTPPSDSASMLFRPYSEDLNVAERPFGMVRYIPQDTGALTYFSATSSAAQGVCGVVIDGAVPGDIVEFTILENYEFIPANNAINLIDPTPSVSDPIEMSIASNAISLNKGLPVAQPSRDPTMGRLGNAGLKVHAAADTRHTGSEPTMFERIVAGMGKALPVVKGVAEAGLNLLPLLM